MAQKQPPSAHLAQYQQAIKFVPATTVCLHGLSLYERTCVANKADSNKETVEALGVSSVFFHVNIFFRLSPPSPLPFLVLHGCSLTHLQSWAPHICL